MPITDISETKNPNGVTFRPIKEKQDIFIPDIKNLNISRRNGMIYALTGSGGSGKSNLMLNLIKSTNCYRNKFNKIYYFCPPSSFSSLENHPFAMHEDVFHELTVQNLANIYNELIQIKGGDEDDVKKKKKVIGFEDDEQTDDSSDEEREVQYSCVIIDDFADQLKNMDIQKMLNRMLIKAFMLFIYFYTSSILLLS
jgi:ABC-type dipeptide/oligopeptide/nickel transport system ATPase component